MEHTQTGIPSSSRNERQASSLKGQHVLVTRQDTPSSSLASMLREAGATVHYFPLIAIAPPTSWRAFDSVVRDIGIIDWVIFTSRNGVGGCITRLRELGFDERILAEKKIACVGRSTASSVQKWRIPVEVVAEHFQSESLADALRSRDLNGKCCWLPQAEVPRRELHDTLTEMNARVIFTPAYRNELPETDFSPLLELIASGTLDWLVFTSPSAVHNLFRVLPEDLHAGFADESRIACLGNITASALQSHGLPITVKPRVQDFRHLVEALCHSVSAP